MKKNRYGGGKVSDLSAHECDGQSHLSVAAHVCINVHCPHEGLVVPYKKKTCETLPGRQSAGRFRWLKSSVQLDGRVGRLLGFSLHRPLRSAAAVLRLSHVLSHVVAMFGGLVGGSGLWRMGTRGQGVGDGHSPRHQPLHRSGNPAGGNAHDTRRESGDEEEVINRCDKWLRKVLEKVCCFSVANQWSTPPQRWN